MDNPKVSVLVPMYNRKHYIKQCLDSALNQTFQENYEIIVRDNCSTDGSYEFVQEKYSKQITEGKIRLYKNDENIGLHRSTKVMIDESKGKYFMILHSDDIYFPHAVFYNYQVAEGTQADVVHSSMFLQSKKNGVLNSLNDCIPIRIDKSFSDEIAMVSNDPLQRFAQWFDSGTYIDAQYNIYNREFVLKNGIFSEEHDYCYSGLLWMMTAKVFVKVPVISYIRRDSPDSGTRSSITKETFEYVLNDMFRAVDDLDKFFTKIKFFKDNELFQYMAKVKYLQSIDSFFIMRNGFLKDGITTETYTIVKDEFKKYYGKDYFYPMFLFNWMHVMPFGRRADVIAPPPEMA